MTISTYEVQNILRTYGKQLGRIRKQADRPASQATGTAGADNVQISAEAKRRQVITKVAHEIIDHIASRPQTKTPAEKEALQQLSQEFGHSLEVFRNRDGGLRFAVVDPEAGKVLADVLPGETERLVQRFSEITQSIVDQNMIT
ncbi:MAG: hypothetical protein JRC92_05155 [Deltaproteobacteria bacterium]|nr:hypothetical protein [Deltaproteobacteria bacterium]